MDSQFSKLDLLKANQLPVIVFGADVVGEVIFHALKDMGIKVEAFCDNNKNKIKYKHCELEIIHAPLIKERYPKALIIIASTYIKDVVSQIEEMGYKTWLDCNPILENFDLYKHESDYSRDIHFVSFSVTACMLSHNGFMDPNRLYIRSIDLIITERCSLKCQDCSNLMQYYEKPLNIEMAEIMKSVEALASVADEIYEMRVIGGEPLVNKDYHAVIQKLNEIENVKRVVVYSNGTIVPQDAHMEILKNPKVIFIITSYGALSRNLAAITDKFDHHKVNYVVQKAAGWTDSGRVKKFNRTEDELEETFRYCCVKNYTTISSGKLYRCPFGANIARLEAAPDDPSDYFSLFKELESGKDMLMIKQDLRNFLTSKKSLKACDFCHGRTYGMPEIEAGIQTKTPLPYERFKTNG